VKGGARRADARDGRPGSLAVLLGRELLRAIAGLHRGCILGPWPGNWHARRAPASSRPPFVSEDDAHGEVELIFVLGGRCALSYDLRHYVIKEGDLVFFPPNLPHFMTRVNRATPYRLADWTVTPDELELMVSGYSPRSGFRFEDTLRVSAPAVELREALRRLARYSTLPEPPSAVALKEVLLTLSLILMRRAITETREDRLNARRSIVEKAERFMSRQRGRPLSLGEVARAVRLSPNYLTSLFRSETGVSLGAHMRKQRVAQAKVMLASTRKSVTQIAYDLRFSDPFAFSRAFKRVEGVSPLAYRRANR